MRFLEKCQAISGRDNKRRKPIAYLARELNPVIEGIIQYYHKLWNAGMRPAWNQLSHRLLKWVKCVYSSFPGFVGYGHATMNNLIYSPIGDCHNHDHL